MKSKGLCLSDPFCPLDPISSPTCEEISRVNVWNNHLHKAGLPYTTERVCCTVLGEEFVINGVCDNRTS